MTTHLINSKECEIYMRENWEHPERIRLYEEVYAVYLDVNGKRIFHDQINKGSFNSTNFNLQLTMQNAWNVHSTNVVLFHNHPSGDSHPNNVDLNFTYELYFMLGKFGINLIDHLIITHTDYYSFKDAGIIEGYRKACCELKMASIVPILYAGLLSLISLFSHSENQMELAGLFG